ncbi:hypothetical protein ACIBCB_34530 [Streptomyces uncialis]|uniref:hypothetical protein n=1 Tax=Streptomyces uncialis TaxID=1048205 RepID=UPI0037AB45E1
MSGTGPGGDGPLIVPPLTDFTTAVSAASGGELLDLGAHFVRRLADPEQLLARAEGLDTGRGTSADALRALFARAAADALRRGRADRAALRATGMALRLAGDADPALTLAVDDLELRDGTTESAPATDTAARRTRLFGPEVELALRWAGDRTVRVLVDTDQQLPAALALVRALGPARVTLCGRFAWEHRAVLGQLPSAAGARFDPAVPARTVRPGWLPGTEDVRWVTVPGERTPGTPWLGWLDVVDAAASADGHWARCRGLTVTVARLDSWETAVGARGGRADLAALCARLRPGTPLAVELLVGAPGTDAKDAAAAVALIADGPAPAPGVRPVLAGLRPFRLPRPSGGGTPPAGWDGVPLRLRPRPEHDLPRWTDFDAPGTLGPAERSATIHALLGDLARDTDLYPGRLAGAAATAHAVGPPADGPPVWDPSARVASTARAAVDGKGPGTFVAHLRTGTAFRLHPRLVEVVTDLAAGGTDRLDRLSPATRTRLLGLLTRAGALAPGRTP